MLIKIAIIVKMQPNQIPTITATTTTEICQSQNFTKRNKNNNNKTNKQTNEQ